MTSPHHPSDTRGRTVPMIEDPLGGRSVQEWVGRSPDSMPPPRIRRRVFLRHGGICHRSGVKIAATDKWQCDHVKALVDGGENRERNLAPILDAPHKQKTAEEVDRRSKADRIWLKSNGQWPKSKRPLQSRGFAPTRPRPQRGETT